MAAEDYVGPPGREKKFHKTHFQVKRAIKGIPLRDDPQWEEYAPGRWRRKKKNNGTQKENRTC